MTTSRTSRPRSTTRSCASATSRSARPRSQLDGDTLAVAGDLTLLGTTRPLAFELALVDGRVTGAAVVKQTEWGMKPYTALFGTLKVADEVRVEIDAGLPQSR